MTKIISSLLFLIAAAASNAQVGINTGNPQTAFHVDGGKDNPSTGVPSSTQEANDFAVNSLGNVGVGTISPSVKLDIKSATPGAVKIVDGTQGEGKVLTSDATGKSSWQDGSLKTIIGATSTSGTLGSNQYLPWGSIILTPGTWLVAAKYTSKNSTNSTFASWIRLMKISDNSEIATSGMVPETVGDRVATPMVQSLITVTGNTEIAVQGTNGCNCASLSPNFGGSQFYAIKLY